LALKETANSTKHLNKNKNYIEILEMPFIFNLVKGEFLVIKSVLWISHFGTCIFHDICTPLGPRSMLINRLDVDWVTTVVRRMSPTVEIRVGMFLKMDGDVL
jgi:hypothetical protein